MNFIVVDDNNYKRERICDNIKAVVGEVDITEYCCAREILLYLHNLRKNDDKDIICKNTMLFLDWNFPFYKGEMIEVAEGDFVLSELERLNFEIPTIIVSSDKIEGLNYNFVLGTIQDDPSVYQLPYYQKLIPEDLHKIEIKNKNYER